MKALALVLVLVPAVAVAEPPTRPLASFDSAKTVARDVIYADAQRTFYCGCDYTPTSTRSGGAIDPTACGYTVRASTTRGSRLEWEHVMPAWFFGHTRSCWSDGHSQCVRSDGTTFRGRECCKRPGVDDEFRRIEADLHNLVPSVGELNGDRSNYPYGLVSGEPRAYGQCDFEVNLADPVAQRLAEPTPYVRGDVARIWLYMSDTYNVSIPDEGRLMFTGWALTDPVDHREILRDERIEAAQGNRNPYVRP